MSVIRLGDIVVNKNLSSITVDGIDLPLEPKLFELLMLFCDHQEGIISRQQILETIWPNSLVTDNAVNKLVASLRKVLKDDPRSPRYIQTVPKRGYRLIAKVEADQTPQVVLSKNELGDLHESNTACVEETASLPTKKNHKLSMLVVLTIIVVIAYLMLMWRPSPLEATAKNTIRPTLKTKALTRMHGLERSPLMSPDQTFLLYLRENQTTGHRSLWRKSLIDESESKIKGISQFTSRLISLTKQDDGWQISYVAQQSNACHISLADITAENTLTNIQSVFDCTGMRIYDVTWSPNKQVIYYSAQAEHDAVSRIYQFDMETKNHSLLTQPDAKGIGNRGVDLSPDGSKLLIVNQDKDFQSKLYALDLRSNKLTPGLTTKHSIDKAAWYFDNQHVMFYNPSPSHQVILSDFKGQSQSTLVSISEYLETEFSRIPNTHDIVFATTNLDFNNRWITHADNVREVSNSTVYDMYPTLAHKSAHYAFISTRSGQEQLYYGDLETGENRALSRLQDHRWVKHLSFSPDDKTLLAGDRGHVWLLDIEEQLVSKSLSELAPEQAVFTSNGALLSAIWLSNQHLYFKVQNEGKIKGFIFDRESQKYVEVDNRWQTLLTDHKSADLLYMVDPVDTQIYQLPIEQLRVDGRQSILKFPENEVKTTGTHIAQDYYDIKIYDGKIYYVTASNSGNTRPYDFQIEVKPLDPASKMKTEIHKTSCSCGYDVAESGFMVSEQVGIEGDIHRTVQ